ncbi:MAG: hypothetical protein AAGP08_05615 [Pseudomonadota bacterium]
MLSCVFLMGTLFVSDGQVMVAMDAVSHVERSGDLLVIGVGTRQDGLDISAYPDEMGVHQILSYCAETAEGAARNEDHFARM